MFTIDAHLDLAMNAMEWNRDLRWEVEAVRQAEEGMKDKPDRGQSTVSFPALRRGGVGLVVATQIARFAPPGGPLPGWASPEQAWAQTQAQLSWYRAMEEAGELRAITSLEQLNRHVAQWMTGDTKTLPIGYILSLEGADSLVRVDYLDRAWDYGLRAVGPGHYGPGRYAHGTNASGAMGKEGLALLKKMDELGIILDATHLCDDAFWQALDHFGGTVWASHNNCRAVVDHNRQFSDEMIRALIRRGAVIGMAMDAWMIVPGWERGRSTPSAMGCTLERALDHLDHICQLAGNTDHVGIGTDLDGGFGREQCPADLDSIADLVCIPELLSRRNYSSAAIGQIMHGNWLRLLRKALK